MYHFNAFISYKHADLDNKVAESIIRDLERYHIPKKIQKSTGIKKIDRVFRDKDELPITSDLNDTISQALINSDFLIVICSTNTKKSTWVEREIEFFIKHHSINNVMTVLADGEPYDVIPKILLSGKKEEIDENGEKKIIETPFEPLSCDYRLPYKKAKAKELPRLVAAIIGCPYDELIDRQRQYKMQRMTAVFSGMMALSIGFAGYMYYSNTQIHKNYLESLRNQSRYLANESLKQLDNSNRIEAMELALEALPKDANDERPVTPEAEKAITDATLAYTTEAGMSVSAVWNYRMSNTVKKFSLSSDRAKLAILDYNDVAKVFDTQNHNELLSLDDSEDGINDIEFFNDNTLIVRRIKSVEAYDLADGTNLWKSSDDSLSYSDYVLNFTDDSILVINSDGIFYELSIKNGSIKSTNPVGDMLIERNRPTDGEGDDDATITVTIDKPTLSDNCKKIAFIAVLSIDYSTKYKTINVYNFDTQELVSTPYEGENVMATNFSGDNIYISSIPDDSDSNLRFADYTYITESRNIIRCLSSEDLSQKWEDELINTDVSIKYDFLPMTNGTIAYYEGNAAKIWNDNTGELVKEVTFNDAIIDASDLDGDGSPLYITHGGCNALSSDDSEKGVTLIKYFADELEDVDYGRFTYVKGYRSSEVICYSLEVHDDEWAKIDSKEPVNMESNNSYCDDDVLAIVSSDGADGTAVYCFNPNTKEYYGKAIIDKKKRPYSFEILGAFDGKLYLASDFDNQLKLWVIDAATMEVTQEIVEEDYGFTDYVGALADGHFIYFRSPDYTKNELVIRDIASKSEEVIEVPNAYYNSCFYDAGTQIGVLCGNPSVIFDLSDKSIVTLESDDSESSVKKACVNSDGSKIAVFDEKDIKLIDKKGQLLSKISCKNIVPLGFSFFKENESEELLLVAYSDGTLLRYSSASGEALGTTDLTTYSGTLYDASIMYNEEDKNLYVSTGGIMDVIDTDSWYETICMGNCVAYHKLSDTFFTYGYELNSSESYIGTFKHYSIEELIDKAKNILGNYELPEEKKSMYGIAN